MTAPAQGKFKNSCGYSPHGESTTAGPDSTNNPNQYTSRENDQTGLMFYRNRYYDPVLKRFVSADPIGLAGGLNEYGYVEGDPLNNFDPDGLRKKAPPIPGNFGKQPYVPDYWRKDTYRQYRQGYYASICVRTSCELESPAGMCTIDDLGGTGKYRKAGQFLPGSGQRPPGCQCTQWALDWREGLRPPNNVLDKTNLLLQTLGVGGYQ